MKIYRQSDGTANVPLYNDIETTPYKRVAREPTIYCAFKVGDIFHKSVPEDQANTWWKILVNDGMTAILEKVNSDYNRDFGYVNLERQVDEDDNEVIAIFLTENELGIEIKDDNNN